MVISHPSSWSTSRCSLSIKTNKQKLADRRAEKREKQQEENICSWFSSVPSPEAACILPDASFSCKQGDCLEVILSLGWGWGTETFLLQQERLTKQQALDFHLSTCLAVHLPHLLVTSPLPWRVRIPDTVLHGSEQNSGSGRDLIAAYCCRTGSYIDRPPTFSKRLPESSLAPSQQPQYSFLCPDGGRGCLNGREE